MSKLSRTKGKVWERAVAQLLRPLFGDKVARGFQSRSGRDGCDVEGTPYWIECKHQARLNVHAAVRQAVGATDGRPVLVIAKGQREVPLVIMTLSEWIAQQEDALPRAVVAGLEVEVSDAEAT